MEIKRLVKNTSYLVVTKVVQFFVGLVRSKLNAVLLGAEGVGIVSQFLILMKSSSQFTTLGMNEAVIKQIAKSRDDKNGVNLIVSSIKTYLVTVSIFIVFSSMLLFFFREDITKYIFGDSKYLNYFFLALLTFPLIIVDGIFFSILRGFKAVKHIARARVFIIVSNFIIFIPLIYFYRLNGAIIYLPISFVVNTAWNLYFANSYYLKPLEIGFYTIFKSKTNSAFQREMLSFSLFGLVVSTLTIVTVFVSRSVVIEHLGIQALGVYRPIVAWAGLFTGFLLPSFNLYLFSRFSELKTNIKVNGVINDALRLGTFAMFPLLLLATPYRKMLIQLFYSKEFLEAANYLPMHFIGVAFQVWFSVLSLSMTPRGYLKQHSIFQVIFLLLETALAFYLVPKYGLNGWMLRFFISRVLLFVVYFSFLKIKTKFQIDKNNLTLMIFLLLSTTVIIIVGVYFQLESISMVLGPIFLIMTLLFLSNDEKRFLHKKIRLLYEKWK